MNNSVNAAEPGKGSHGRFLVLVAGLGGLFYGIDIGINDPALMYLGSTMSMTVENKCIILAAVLGGTTFAAMIAGLFADPLGRKAMMRISAVLSERAGDVRHISTPAPTSFAAPFGTRSTTSTMGSRGRWNSSVKPKRLSEKCAFDLMIIPEDLRVTK